MGSQQTLLPLGSVSAETEAAYINDSAMTLQNAGFFVPSNSTTAMPSSRVSKINLQNGEQSRSTPNNSFPRRRLAPLKPKTPASSQSAEVPSINDKQKLSRPLLPSSEMTLASRVTSSVTKGKRRRSVSPLNVPKDFLCMSSTAAENETVKEERQKSTVAKRVKAGKACLRCQLYKEPVSSQLGAKQSTQDINMYSVRALCLAKIASKAKLVNTLRLWYNGNIVLTQTFWS